MTSDLEIPLSEGHFQDIRKLLKAQAGIELGPGKRAMVSGRLSRRLRSLSLQDYGEYLRVVADPASGEATSFLNALTTNVTEFFREAHHFELLEREILPKLRRDRPRSDRRVRLWSAGCSSGEEPYSLAMVLADALPAAQGWDVKILATDIDSDILALAEAGIYDRERAGKVGGERLRRFFQQGTGRRAGQVRIRGELRRLVAFKRLNLMAPWPVRGPLEAIFCRNVIIYFDSPTRAGLARRFVDLLPAGGHLFLGHSESLVAGSLPVAPCGQTVYRKRG